MQADKEITIFSKEGKLHQLEYAVTAVKNQGNTSLGVRGKDSVVVITQKKVPDKSIVASSVTRVFKVTDRIGVLFTGFVPDSKYLLIRMRQEAGDFKYENGYEIPINVLAEKMCELAQYFSQHYYIRALCVVSLLFTIDDERKPQLFKIDPAGHYTGYRATAAGEKEQEAISNLEKEFRKERSLNADDTMRLAIKTLQDTLSSDFKNTDIEIAVVSTENQNVKILSPEDIEKELAKIGEAD